MREWSRVVIASEQFALVLVLYPSSVSRGIWLGLHACILDFANTLGLHRVDLFNTLGQHTFILGLTNTFAENVF